MPGRVTTPRIELSRAQILAHRRRVGALDERLPPGPRSLERAAWAGMQDSMPRAALLSIHARVAGTEPSTWEDPSLVQLWGPRFSAYVVAARDRAVFTLGRLPDDTKGRQVAEEIATRLHAFLAGRQMTYGEAGRGLGVHPNRLRYAAPTGTVLMRWEGARQPQIWTVQQPETDPPDARLELARRFIHVFGPTTPAAFAELGRDRSGNGPRSVRGAQRIAGARPNTDWRPVDPERRRAVIPGSPLPRCPGPPAPQRRRLLPPSRSRSRAPGARGRSSPRAMDAARLARRRACRGRGSRNLATCRHARDDPVLASSDARQKRSGGGRGGVFASTRPTRPDRCPLGRLRSSRPIARRSPCRGRSADSASGWGPARWEGVCALRPGPAVPPSGRCRAAVSPSPAIRLRRCRSAADRESRAAPAVRLLVR